MYEVETGRPADAGRGFDRGSASIAPKHRVRPAPLLLSEIDVVTPLFYWRALWRWRLLLLAAIVAGSAIGACAAWIRTPTYRARTILRPLPAPELVSQFSL